MDYVSSQKLINHLKIEDDLKIEDVITQKERNLNQEEKSVLIKFFQVILAKSGIRNWFLDYHHFHSEEEPEEEEEIITKEEKKIIKTEEPKVRKLVETIKAYSANAWRALIQDIKKIINLRDNVSLKYAPKDIRIFYPPSALNMSIKKQFRKNIFKFNGLSFYHPRLSDGLTNLKMSLLVKIRSKEIEKRKFLFRNAKIIGQIMLEKYKPYTRINPDELKDRFIELLKIELDKDKNNNTDLIINQLEQDYNQLKDGLYIELHKDYDQLKEKYIIWKKNYILLEEDYYKFSFPGYKAKDYNPSQDQPYIKLKKNYNQLQNDFSQLTDDCYTEFQKDYNQLQNDFSQLKDDYDILKNDYDILKNNRIEDNIKILIVSVISAAFCIVFFPIITSMNKKRKNNRKKRFLYSL